jgi:hypothetical protein
MYVNPTCYDLCTFFISAFKYASRPLLSSVRKPVEPEKECFVTGRWRDDLEFLLTPGLPQAVLDILKLLAALGNTVFVKTLTEICILAKVSNIIPISN